MTNNDMIHEPARTIGSKFADAQYVKTLITAIVAVIGAIAPQLITSLNDTVQNSITTIIVALAGIYLTTTAKQVPIRQAEETRDAVYSPASVQSIGTKAAKTGRVPDIV